MSMSLRIDCRYAGGNIRKVAAEGNRIVLEQDIRDTTEWWFYWNFRAVAEWAGKDAATTVPAGAEEGERVIVFEFANGDVIGPWGPTVSEDGVSWRWLGAESLLSRSSFRYRFSASTVGKSVFFAFGLPYQLHHFERFYAGIAADPRVRRDVLTVSEQLRPVPLLQVGNPEAGEHIVLTCRHHACESTPSYMLEGLLAYYLAQPQSPVLDAYRIHYVPFVDIDGVENGDQGKSRAPHDHNRDYIDRPIFRSTAALIAYAGGLRLAAGIDCHGPFKWGGRNDVPFFVQQHSPHKEEIERISGHLQRITAARETPQAIRHRSADDIAMGEDWNQPHGRNCSAFFVRAGARLACTLELPYFGSGDTVYTVDSCRRFGADFAQALEAYLLERP